MGYVSYNTSSTPIILSDSLRIIVIRPFDGFLGAYRSYSCSI